MAYIIPEENAEIGLSLLKSVCDQSCTYHWEFHEGGSEILFIVFNISLSTESIEGELNTKIRETFDHLFAPKGVKFNWTVIFKKGDDIVTSLFQGIDP